jgi:acyl carrier protein
MDPTLENLKAIIADMLVIDPDTINPLDSFQSMDIDSLDLTELIMECEEQFDIEIPDEDAGKIKTVAGLYGAILTAQGATID